MSLFAPSPPLHRIAQLAGLLALIAMSQTAFGQEPIENKKIIGNPTPLKTQSDSEGIPNGEID